MPWTAHEFASRHNKKLRGASAKKAAEQANAMIKDGVDEGVAIATANKTGNRMHAEGRKSRLYTHARSKG
jgi:uncharacterized protein YdaT